MGRKKTYTEKTLRKAARTYFDSITRVVKLTEKQDTGKRDEYGHAILKDVPVKNCLGEQAEVLEYLVPPTIGGLCIHLGIVSSTWTRWKDKTKYPELQTVIEEIEDRVINWNKEQVVTRKDVKGLIWNLEVNHGCGKKEEDTEQVTVILEGALKDYAG